MIELRTALTTKLKTIHPRIYFQTAPKDAAFPYFVFDFPGISDDGEYEELCVVDVDGWDANADTTALESLMSAVNAALNKSTLTAANMVVALFLDRKIPLLDDDPRIRRRKYVYQARLFRRG